MLRKLSLIIAALTLTLMYAVKVSAEEAAPKGTHGGAPVIQAPLARPPPARATTNRTAAR